MVRSIIKSKINCEDVKCPIYEKEDDAVEHAFMRCDFAIECAALI